MDGCDVCADTRLSGQTHGFMPRRLLGWMQVYAVYRYNRGHEGDAIRHT